MSPEEDQKNYKTVNTTVKKEDASAQEAADVSARFFNLAKELEAEGWQVEGVGFNSW